jgi:hypothetical protein
MDQSVSEVVVHRSCAKSALRVQENDGVLEKQFGNICVGSWGLDVPVQVDVNAISG